MQQQEMPSLIDHCGVTSQIKKVLHTRRATFADSETVYYYFEPASDKTTNKCDADGGDNPSTNTDFNLQALGKDEVLSARSLFSSVATKMGDKVFPAVQTGEPTFENIINEVQDKEGSPHDQVNQDLLPRGDFQSQCHGAGSDLRGGAMECDQARHLADKMQLLSQCLAGEGQARFNKFALTIRSTAEEVADKMFERAVRHRCHGEQHRIIKGGSAAYTNRSHTQHTPPSTSSTLLLI